MDFDNIFEGLHENKKTIIISLLVIVIIIVFSILNFFFNKNKSKLDVESVVESFAQIYYEDSYYSNVKEFYGDAYVEKLQIDENHGIRLTLRDIVNKFEDVDAANFYDDGIYCNFLKTYAIIYPKSPYEVKDYEIEVVTSCDKEL